MIINQSQLVCFPDDVELPGFKTWIAVHTCIHCTAANFSRRHLPCVVGINDYVILNRVQELLE